MNILSIFFCTDVLIDKIVESIVQEEGKKLIQTIISVRLESYSLLFVVCLTSQLAGEQNR